MSTSAFEAISTLTVDTTQLQNTGTAQNPNLSFTTNPVVVGNLIVGSGNMLEFRNPGNNFSASFKAGALTSNLLWTWPLADSSGTQALVSNGSGILSWSTVGMGTVTSITAGTNLTGGTITTSGTIALSSAVTGITLDNSVIGGTTSANGTFTNLSLNGTAPTFNFNGTTSNTITTLAGTNGTIGTAASPLTLTMGASGNSTGANTGANGAALIITGSAGGNSGTGSPGSGGAITITGGLAGSSSNLGLFTFGGNVNLTGGSAGSGTSFISGGPGNVNLTGGQGITITSGTNTAGNGGIVQLLGGTGGNQLGTGKSGNGGVITIIGGNAGNATAGNGGNAGGIVIQSGVPFIGTSTNGNGGNSGNIQLNGVLGGAGNGSGTGGNGGNTNITASSGGAGGATGAGGTGGNLAISSGGGGAGNGGANGGAAGNITITAGIGGTGAAAGTDGNIILKTNNTYIGLQTSSSTPTQLRFYNSASSQYVGFVAGSLSTNTIWTLPTADAVGTFVSDGSGNISLTPSPSIFRSIVSVSTTTKTFALADANTFQQCSNGSTQTLTVDTNANVAFPIGTEIDIYQEGAGQVVIVAAGGVTIESVFSNLKIANQYTGATLKKLAINTWALTGNLTA